MKYALSGAPHQVRCAVGETGFGRLRSAESGLLARAAADRSDLLPVDRCSGYELQRYPGGNAPYLYGSLLHGLVAGRVDSAAWDRYNARRGTGLPFFENTRARQVLRTGLKGASIT